MLADRGYDADWFRDALEQKGIITAEARKLVTNALCKARKACGLQGAWWIQFLAPAQSMELRLIDEKLR